MCIYNKYMLKENSQIIIGQSFNSSIIEIFLKDELQSNFIKSIYQIPRISFIEEIESDFKDVNRAKLVACYHKQVGCGADIEIIDIDLENKKVLKNKKIDTKDFPKRLSSGIYVYTNPNNLTTIISAYGKELQPQKFSIQTDDKIIHISNIEINYLSQEASKLFELCLYFNRSEILRTILKVPTEPYDEFEVSRFVYRDLTSEEYYIWDKQNDKEFVPFSTFIQRLTKSKLAQEIINQTNQKLDQKKKILTKMQNYIKNN